MGVIKQPFLAKKVVVAKFNSAESSTVPTTDDESVASGHVTPLPPSQNTRDPRTGVCPAQLRRGLGHRLRMKQGRRSQQRCDNEKLLMAMYGIEEEDITGEDIIEEKRSHFKELLDGGNKELLDTFVNNEEPKFFSKPKLGRKGATQNEEEFEPEDSFLNIGANLRQALKRHLPIGMLEGLESRVE